MSFEKRSMSPFGSTTTTLYPFLMSCSTMFSMSLVFPMRVVPKSPRWPLLSLSGIVMVTSFDRSARSTPLPMTVCPNFTGARRCRFPFSLIAISLSRLIVHLSASSLKGDRLAPFFSSCGYYFPVNESDESPIKEHHAHPRPQVIHKKQDEFILFSGVWMVSLLKVGHIVSGVVAQTRPDYRSYLVFLTGSEIYAFLPHEYAKEPYRVGADIIAAVVVFDGRRIILSQTSSQYYRRVAEVVFEPLINARKIMIKRVARIRQAGFVKIAIENLGMTDEQLIPQCLPYLEGATHMSTRRSRWFATCGTSTSTSQRPSSPRRRTRSAK